jgi:hypothetical protein
MNRRLLAVKILNFSRFVLCSLALGITLSSCTPEKRAVLKTTAVSFADQAITALDLTQTIYQIEAPRQTSAEIIGETVKEVIAITPSSDYPSPWRNVQEVEKLILANQPNTSPSELQKQLDIVKEEYRTAALLYTEVEKVDYESKKLIDDAKVSAKRLTLKMYRLGKWILENPPRPLDGQRVILSEKLGKLDLEYHNLDDEAKNSNISPSRKAEIYKRQEEIQQEFAKTIEAWLVLHQNEKKMLCDAVFQIQKATATGVSLSKLSDDYGKVDINIIFRRLNEVVGIASTVTGKDYSSIRSNFEKIKTDINNDQALKELISEILRESSPNSPAQPDKFLTIRPELDCSHLGGN